MAKLEIFRTDGFCYISGGAGAQPALALLTEKFRSRVVSLETSAGHWEVGFSTDSLRGMKIRPDTPAAKFRAAILETIQDLPYSYGRQIHGVEVELNI